MSTLDNSDFGLVSDTTDTTAWHLRYHCPLTCPYPYPYPCLRHDEDL